MKTIFFIFFLIILIILIIIIYNNYYNMKWKNILEKWNKEPIKYPDNIKNSFFWETKPITNEKSIFKQKFIQNKYLNNLKQNYSPFQNEINKSKNKYVTSFYNLSGDTLLIVPIPKKGKTLQH